MTKYVISIRRVDVEDDTLVRYIHTSFPSLESAVNYIRTKYCNAKRFASTSDEFTHGIMCKYVYKRYGENNRISTYLINIHRVELKEDDYDEKT